ncbi:MAG: hydantoinase B/oxoprolinase family protein [Chloroflexi bacterium]|nr:hydantoinase B/oxoprolinase family protein [Chloroflexota bacterium]
MPATVYDAATLEILWNGLTASADEAAATLVRTSFSTIVRESNDFACVLLDAEGDTLAESHLSIPSFVGCLPHTVKHLLRRFPPDIWQPGDVVVTNDPWLATGHRPDITMAMPIFHRGELVGFAGSIAHSPDIGGALWSADCREVFEEGLGIPPLWLYRAGALNRDLIELYRANSRVPDQAIGDLHAQVAAGEVLTRRLIEMLEDRDIRDLRALSVALQARAEAAMRAAIRALPDGTYRSAVQLDGYDEPLRIACAVTVHDDELCIDYAGTSPQVDRGLNCVLVFTRAYSIYPVKCVLDPETPKNEGAYRPIQVVAPEGCLVNPRFPAPVNARHLVGQVLSSAILEALFQALPERVIADSGSAPAFRTVFSGVGRHGERFQFTLFANGGMGARPTADGLPCTPFPTNSACASIEVMESLTPLTVWAKQVRPDSGGPGTWRGGYGQEIIVQVSGDQPVTLSVLSDRGRHPARGLRGGRPGACVDVQLVSRQANLPRKGRAVLQPGDVVALRYAGGGGYGDPRQRDPALVCADVRSGVVSPAAACEVYGLAQL